MEPLTAVPKLYTIESTAYPGYCITQQGTQIVLKFKDALNPFQLWYRDESWQFLGEDNSDLSALVFINHGSKKALRSQSSSTSRSIAKTGNSSVFLSHISSSRSSFKDGVPVVTSAQGENSRWKIVAYVPSQVYRILCHWFGNYLTWKQQNVDVLLTQFDPLDYGFVWSEDRFQASNTDYVAINLDGTNLQWSLQNDDQYQNSINYCMLSSHFIALNEIFKATVGDYDPVVEDNPLLWSVSASSDDQVSITMTGNSSVFLSHTPALKTGPSGDIHPWWKLPVEARYLRASQDHRILCHWFRNYLTWKQQNVDVTFKDVVKHNNETNVVLVSPNNISLDSMVCSFDCNTMILDHKLMLIAIHMVQGS
ncbi:hypothetical protein SELMODRAFT_403711 [Selaginella moellendorffii]|uniref:Uncharacterized protein n=1 Tax=Selaginella moellendorffii TaxID=88036 RepID=D8QSA1_SELML|nr:hypothetical protein SELMODRAFT_403711 [Selaginella moellendorffii]